MRNQFLVRTSSQPRLTLVPGMPAEVMIKTGDRTALSYLVKPLSDQILRAFRED